jgi:hypothetical protein
MKTTRIKNGKGTLICGESKTLATYRLTVIGDTPGAHGTLTTDAKFASKVGAECIMTGRLMVKGQDFDVMFTKGARIGAEGTLPVSVTGPVGIL